jgi:hypothetical protein
LGDERGELRGDVDQHAAQPLAGGGREVAGLALPEHADPPVVERGLRQRAGAGPAVQVRLDGGEHVVDDLVEQVVLAAEVTVQRGGSDGDGVGDVGHGDLGVALAREQLGRGVEDQSPPVAGPRAAGGEGCHRAAAWASRRRSRSWCLRILPDGVRGIAPTTKSCGIL